MKQKILLLFMAVSCGFIFSCSGVNSRLEIEKSAVHYSKPRSSTKLLKGEKVAYQLWIDKSKWEIFGSKDAGFLDFRNMQGSRGTGLSHVLKHNSGESLAVIQEINKPADFGTLHKALSESLSMRQGSIISDEIRTVNGSEILFIKWIEDLGTSKIVWLSYYLSNKTGHMRLAGGATEQLFAIYKSDIVGLLNGLVDSDSRLPTTAKDEQKIEKKLSKLKRLLKAGLISQKDYDKKKTELLEEF